MTTFGNLFSNAIASTPVSEEFEWETQFSSPDSVWGPAVSEQFRASSREEALEYAQRSMEETENNLVSRGTAIRGTIGSVYRLDFTDEDIAHVLVGKVETPRDGE